MSVSRAWNIDDKDDKDCPWLSLRLWKPYYEEGETRIIFEGDGQLPTEFIPELIEVLKEIQTYAD